MSYLYALRHKPTGRFLPRPPSGQKGGTWVEPSINEVPRFFHRERDAKGFLTIWCQGPLVKTYSQDWESGHEEVDWEPDLKQAAEPRIKEDWEVVKISWSVV